jgi:hypothetical protein
MIPSLKEARGDVETLRTQGTSLVVRIYLFSAEEKIS